MGAGRCTTILSTCADKKGENARIENAGTLYSPIRFSFRVYQ